METIVKKIRLRLNHIHSSNLLSEIDCLQKELSEIEARRSEIYDILDEAESRLLQVQNRKSPTLHRDESRSGKFSTQRQGIGRFYKKGQSGHSDHPDTDYAQEALAEL